MDDALRGQLSRLWAEHRSAPFPARLRHQDVAGVEMVMLDADIAGCVDYLLSVGSLDQWRQAILARRIGNLRSVLPHLADEAEAVYYNRLRVMAELAAAAEI